MQKKLHMPTRISTVIVPTELKLLMNSFIKPQFRYGPLVWMVLGRGSNSKINRIQRRALQLVCRENGREVKKQKKSI